MQKFSPRSATRSLVLIGLAAGIFTGCSSHQDKANDLQNPIVQGEMTCPSAAQSGPSASCKDANGKEINLKLFHAKKASLIAVEGTFSDDTFINLQALYAQKPQAERNQLIHARLEDIFKTLTAAGAIPISETDEVAFFNFYFPYSSNPMAALKNLKVPGGILLNPVVYNPNELKDIKALNPAAEGLLTKGSHVDTSNFSGLERVRAPEFVALAQSQIGGDTKVDGSSVNIGITDTGITYNHPTFLSRDGKTNRIAYMKDFTGEGALYFSPAAKFTATAGAGAEDILVSAEVLLSDKLPSLPAATDLTELKGVKFKVSAELRAKLLDPKTQARLGVMDEAVFQSEEDAVDLNGNGKVDDLFPAIMIMGETPEDSVVYFDPTATNDFRQSVALGDWNKTHTTMPVLAEQFGFNIKSLKLPAPTTEKPNATADVVSAVIVGFDPGNHGSHVSGIAAGNKTISNDSDTTLARGVAPEAHIMMNRICANNGGCDGTAAFIDLAINAKAEVINMSLGGLSPFNNGYGVQETMINRLTTFKNVLFVISAGNSGPGRQTIGSPSTARLSLSVGASASRGMIERQYEWPGAGSSATDATDDSDFMLFFSSRGPTAAGGFKPNISAPGTELSSVELNAGPGSHAGLDIYWGTSMAAPTATGSFALFLDGVKKYNLKNPDAPLSTNAVTLRNVLIESARPFDMGSFDPATGKKSQGQYSWIDEGTGMIDLVAAWNKLIELKNAAVPSAVMLDGKSIDLDYNVLVSTKNPKGFAYDGSSAGAQNEPAFGAGLFIDYFATNTLANVQIARRLPDDVAASKDAGSLIRQLVTTQDEFVLKTVYTSPTVNDKDYPQWVKAGTLDQLNCGSSKTSNLTIMGRGVEITVKPDSTGALDPNVASSLNVCLDRDAIKNQLAPGDHGALIYAYRTAGGKVSPVASFIVPVYVTVPNKVLENSTGYEINHSVTSFGVDRNYVYIPKGTSVVRITIEVPTLEEDSKVCSGVELMALLGENTDSPFKTRAEARIENCMSNGSVAPKEKRSLTFSKVNPTPGMWDLPVFGSYKYVSSKYKMSVEYVVGSADVKSITMSQGDGTTDHPSTLTGSFNWTLKDASMVSTPDTLESTFEISGLASLSQSQVAKDAFVIVDGALGKLRAYPVGVKSVTIKIGNSPGNDIDLLVMACPAEAKTADECKEPVGLSNGPTDSEQVTFVPEQSKVYAVRVDGATVKDDGKFLSLEILNFDKESGVIEVGPGIPGTGKDAGTTKFKIGYEFPVEKVAKSSFFGNDLFKSGKYNILGSITLKTDGTILGSVPVVITK